MPTSPILVQTFLSLFLPQWAAVGGQQKTFFFPFPTLPTSKHLECCFSEHLSCCQVYLGKCNPLGCSTVALHNVLSTPPCIPNAIVKQPLRDYISQGACDNSSEAVGTLQDTRGREGDRERESISLCEYSS